MPHGNRAPSPVNFGQQPIKGMFLAHVQGFPVARRCDGLGGFFGFAATGERVLTFRNLHQPREVGGSEEGNTECGSTLQPRRSWHAWHGSNDHLSIENQSLQTTVRPGGFWNGKFTTSDEELGNKQLRAFNLTTPLLSCRIQFKLYFNYFQGHAPLPQLLTATVSIRQDFTRNTSSPSKENKPFPIATARNRQPTNSHNSPPFNQSESL